MALKQTLQAAAVRETLRYVARNPGENIGRIFSLLRPFVRVPEQRAAFDQIEAQWRNPDYNWRRMTERAFSQLSPVVMEKFVTNFLVNAAFVGVPKRAEAEEKLQCNVPWAILMDPTSDCNLHCKGCWAEEYQRGSHLSLEELDSIIQQGKELGVYFYLYSGGEPLLRAADIITLAKKHSDCVFCAFTNATLVTPELAKGLAEVGNVMLAISVEGFDDANDFRRGRGSYAHVSRAMDLLREAGAPFGFSACYHHYNTEAVASETFVDAMIEKGCFFGWFFTYMPLGRHAHPDFLVTPEQRKLMYDRVRDYRGRKDIFLLDFWNDGEYSNGCIAGGRRYLHINAHGDVEPCAFIHYSNVNIRDVSLVEALRSPLFMQYRQRQPFNSNHLRPCPLLDNPDQLVAMVKESGAYSTQRRDNEDVEALAGKCFAAAERWASTADEIWNSRKEQQEAKAVS